MTRTLPTSGAPQYLFVEVTSECNLRCKQCHLWRTREPATSLSTAEKLALVTDFAGFATRPTVVLTGGEPTSKLEEFFALTKHCRTLGVSCAANTNGTLLDASHVERLLADGPRYLVISLDSHRPDVHDYIRGVRGTFQRATTLIRAVVEGRQNRLSDVRVLVNATVMDLNVRELDSLVSFATELGVDGVTFQMLGRTFALSTRRDAFFEKHFPRNLDQFDQAMDALVVGRAAGRLILTSDEDFRWMKLYVRDPDFVGEAVCGSHEKNVMVDMMGNVQLCFAMRSLLGGRDLGNVRERSLAELWASEAASAARGLMQVCRKNCGMLNCHRRAS